jgi:hypothetical protein
MHFHSSNQASFELGFGGYTANWGIHICGLYENEQERDAVILNFLCKGNAAGDLQLYCAEDRLRQDFTNRMALCCPDCARDMSDPTKFQIYAPKDLYYPRGTFLPLEMDTRLSVFYASCQAAGPRNLRATGEMVWSRNAIPGAEHLMVYEARLNNFISRRRMAAICLYDLNFFPGSTILNVLRTHPYEIIAGVITENPYYQRPADWLKAHAPEFASIN